MNECVKSEEIGASRSRCERLDNSFHGGRAMLQTHSWRTASLVMALTAIVGLALPALGDDWRPFRGHSDEVRISVQPVGDVILVTTSGVGQATHLGSFTRLASGVIHVVDGRIQGTVVFTAANGDQLFAEIEGGPLISSTTRVGTYTFTGGTGRFSDASEVADFEGFTSDGIHIAVTFEGTIQY
jgi:hypothetical protein